MFGYIYKTTNLINEKIYVGQKKAEKFVPKYFGSGIHLNSALCKYGKENFTVELLDWADTPDLLNLLERLWIWYYREEVGRDMLYNIADGGDGGATRLGYKNSVQHRQILIESNKSRVWTEESKRKMVETRRAHYPNWMPETFVGPKGRKLSEETKKKIGDTHRGMVRSEEAKANMRESWKHRKRVPWHHTEESRKKIGNAFRGKKLPPEHHKKVWETRRKNKELQNEFPCD